MKVAIYLRVSTTTNKKKKSYRGQTLENQLPDIMRFIAAREHEVYKTYSDDMSAVKNRPQWNQMMSDAFEGQFKAILVWKLDRFARSMIDLVVSIDKLAKWGVGFIAVTQGIDTTDNSAMARVFVHLLGLMAEFERSIISERVKAGMARKRAEGGVIGRAPVVFDMSKADRLHDTGMSWGEISRTLNVKKSTLRDHMKGYYDRRKES